MDKFPDFNAKGFDINNYNKQFQRSNIIIDAASRQIGFSRHWGGLSIKCAFDGYEYYESDGEFYAVNDSSYLIFNEGKYYSSFIDSKKEVRSFSVNFTPELEKSVFHSLNQATDKLLDNPDAFVGKFHFNERVAPHHPSIRPRMNAIMELTADWNENQEEIKEHLFFLLEQMIINEMDRESGNALHVVKEVTKKELLKRMAISRDYITSNFTRNLTLEDIADVACMNEYYFLRQFKKMFATTPHHYLQQLRIKESLRLLRENNDSVKEICGKIGFQDPASFGKLFKKIFGQTPKEFRLMYRQNQKRHGANDSASISSR